MNRDERNKLAKSRWEDEDFRKRMSEKYNPVRSGTTLVQCMDSDCELEGCHYCVMSVLTHDYGISTEAAGWYCPFQSNRPIPVKQLAISFSSAQSDLSETMNFIEQNTGHTGIFTKELEGITDKSTFKYVPDNFCCGVVPSDMISLGNPVTEHNEDGEVNITYNLKCPTCHKKYRYTERYAYRGKIMEVTE